MIQNDTDREGISFIAATEEYPGLFGWLMSRDHKKIGIMYTVAILSFFAVGSMVGLLLRLSLIAPGQILSAQAYNGAFAIHGIIQIFLFVIPGIPGCTGILLMWSGYTFSRFFI